MLDYFLYHCIAFGMGFVLDLIIGDPEWFCHPVCLIGRLIAAMEKRYNDPKACPAVLIRRGIWMAAAVITLTLAAVGLLTAAAYLIHPVVGCVVEAIVTSTALAAKSLKVESKKTEDALKSDGIEAARAAVSMIVGRDTDALDEEGVIKAAVETVAENTCDGVIAPMLYLAIGGPVLGYIYKAVNTMDSMVGYHNSRYEYYGKAAAVLDDIANFIPARMSGILLVISAGIDSLIGRDRSFYSAKEAWRIFKRDRQNHKSPNSAQSESACAGALGVMLAGDAFYFGELHRKPTIGDDNRKIEAADIGRSHKLMYTAAFLCFVFCEMILIGIYLYVEL